jgi:hypothetical protein
MEKYYFDIVELMETKKKHITSLVSASVISSLLYNSNIPSECNFLVITIWLG